MSDGRDVKVFCRITAALAALREVSGMDTTKVEPMNEARQGAYLAEVRAGLLQTFGVPAPDGLDRLILAAGVCALSPERCVAFLGDHFELEALPPRIQSRSRSN